MRIALLSNVTAEVLAGMMKENHSVWLPPGFGAWMETALNPPDEMRAFAPEVIVLLLDSTHAQFSEADAAVAIESLEGAFPAATVIVPDLADLADEVGDFKDEKMWRLASMPWSLKGLHGIEAEIGRLIDMVKTGGKKVLAVDFDGTLWDGVVGEDGVDGIAPRVEFQRWIKSLKDRGVLIVGLSKNNAADVEPVWSDARMVLEKNDFADMRVDWDDKPANLKKVVGALNLGLDSVVFLDDNPAECAQMRTALPDVEVPEFPSDVAAIPKFMRRVSRLYFPLMRTTDEDRRRSEFYRADAARREFSTGRSIEEYLTGLEIWVDVHAVRDEEIPRVAQLSQKTNQFNVCTNRYTVADVTGFAKDANRLVVSVHAGDRFGDQGLVAFVHVVVEGDRAEVVDWVMSCRAMNRRLEYAVEERVESMLAGRGVASLCAEWRRTAKNAPVEDLFDKFGFELVGRDEHCRRYRAGLPRKMETAHGVSVRGC